MSIPSSKPHDRACTCEQCLRELAAPAPATPAATDTLLSVLREGIPLQEPVNITKAVLAQREARVCLSGGTGPVACAMLVNIQLTPWADGPDKAEAFASGYNTAMKWYRAALLDLLENTAAATGQPSAGQDERALFDSLYDAFEFRKEYDKYGPSEAAFTVFQYGLAAGRASLTPTAPAKQDKQ